MPKKIMSFFCLLFLLVSPVLAQGETYTIVVTASRIPQGILDAPVAVSIVTAEEIEASGVQTVEDALRLVSGLTIRSQGPVGSQASVSLRGSTSAQVLVLVDGRPINCPRSGGVDLSNIPTGNVERIEVLKGPASALYGADALAGVINIITKGASGRGGYLHTSLGSNGYRFYRGQIQDGSDTLDLFLHADWTGSASFPQSSFGDYEQIAFGGRLDYQISPFSSWTFLGNYKSDSLVDYMFGENLQVHDEGSMDLRYERFLGSGKDMMARVFRRWDRMGYGFSDHRSQSRGMEVQLNLDAGSHQLVVGGNLAYAEVESTDLPDPKPSREWALYGQDIYSLQENFDLVLGTRLDSFSRFGVALSPRLGGVFRLNDETSIHFSVAKAFRAPTFNELYYKSQGSYNEGTYKYKWDDSGNPNLDPERAWGYEVGLRHGSVEDSLSLALFQRDVKDLISWVYSQEEYREDGKQVILYKTRVQNTSQARIRGGEVEWTKTSASGSEAKLGYTYLDAVDMDTHWPLAHIPRHQGWLSLAGRIAEGTSMQWQTVFVDKRPTGMGDLAPYAVMDVTLGQEINDQLEVNLQIENLLDEKYEEQFSYPAPPRSYILGLKYSF